MTGARSAVRAARLERLRPRHAIDAAQAAAVGVVLLGVELGLHTIGVERLARLLGLRFLNDVSAMPHDAGAPLVAGEQRWLRNASRVLRRWPLDRSCLRRACLVGWILRQRKPVLVIGVRRRDEAIEAHAWVRIGDRDLDDSATTYAAFDRASHRARA